MNHQPYCQITWTDQGLLPERAGVCTCGAAKAAYRDGLDEVENQVIAGTLLPDAALAQRLGLICDLYIAEGGTREQFLDLLCGLDADQCDETITTFDGQLVFTLHAGQITQAIG